MGSAKERLVRAVRGHGGGQIAIEQGERSVTYAELGRLLEARASALGTEGAAGALVAIERRKSVEFVVDLLAVLAVGGAAVPLDPDGPADRRATFLDLVRPALLLDDSGVACLDGAARRTLPADGAFVYFTSGSTGVPKPVLGSAAGLAAFASWFREEFEVGARDRAAYVAGVSFEATSREVFPPLCAGATLVLPEAGDLASPEAAVAWLGRRRVTLVTVVPSVARGWLRDGGGVCPDVRAAFFIGEPVPADVLTGWRSTFPETAELVNSYGSTESGQATIVNRVARGEEARQPVPAGRPVPGTRFCLIEPGAALDAGRVRDALERPPASGEIVIVSRFCSHGYLGMPEATAARFAELGDGVKAYRTGDLGRMDERGDLVVTGRVDDEVKINGVRVHPAEVTRAIRARPAVGDAFVIATDAAGDVRLIAFVMPAAGGALRIGDLRRDLVEALPPAMIPSRFVEVPELPRARTGKVDRSALVALAEGAAAPAEHVEPDGDAERWVADRFRELLGVDRVSAADDLFALGGDSITATRLAARAARDLGVDVSQRAILAAPTVSGIAAAIVEEQLLAADPAELHALLDGL
ncbi:MAG TPA: non-ribosomal peptide synthetase [Candidatus Dormibacteraeota bacterium]|nr:non-ribosomal peptide synthetase [Candidatus Dormibacteraeota bacterium]